jgi:sugar phosphate isomerase/epimerase
MTDIPLGCCAFNFGWLAWQESLRLVRDLGFTHVDVGGNQVGQEEAALAPARVGAEIRAAARDLGLAPEEFFVCDVVVNGEAVQTNHPDAQRRALALDRFRGLCRCAAEAGFRSIMGVPGVPQPSLSDDEAWEIAVTQLTAMVAIAGEYGVQLNVEPHAGSIVQAPERALRLVEDVPGLRYTLDYAHFVGQSIPQAAVAPLHAYAGHLHAKPARPGYPKCLAHRSTIDFAAILDDLAARGWSGVVALECIGRMDEALGRPIFQEISADDGALPPKPDLLHHPVAQTMALAYEMRVKREG